MSKKEIRELLHGNPYLNLFKLLVAEVSLSKKGGKDLTLEQEEVISTLFKGGHKILKYKRSSGTTTAIQLFLAANFLFKKYKSVTLVTRNVMSAAFSISNFLSQMEVLRGDVIQKTTSICSINMDDIQIKVLGVGTLDYKNIEKDDLVIFDNIDNCDKGSELVTPNFGIAIYTSDIMSFEDHYKKTLDEVIKICRADKIDYKKLAHYIGRLENISIDIQDIQQELDFFK